MWLLVLTRLMMAFLLVFFLPPVDTCIIVFLFRLMYLPMHYQAQITFTRPIYLELGCHQHTKHTLCMLLHVYLLQAAILHV